MSRVVFDPAVVVAFKAQEDRVVILRVLYGGRILGVVFAGQSEPE
jgi:plasmid stabilization system protein ParE